MEGLVTTRNVWAAIMHPQGVVIVDTSLPNVSPLLFLNKVCLQVVCADSFPVPGKGEEHCNLKSLNLARTPEH